MIKLIGVTVRMVALVVITARRLSASAKLVYASEPSRPKRSLGHAPQTIVSAGGKRTQGEKQS